MFEGTAARSSVSDYSHSPPADMNGGGDERFRRGSSMIASCAPQKTPSERRMQTRVEDRSRTNTAMCGRRDRFCTAQGVPA